MRNTLLIIALLATGCGSDLPPDIQAAYDDLSETVDFNQHVRPILADRCFACHGPDDQTREANLRLDLEDHAFAALESGAKAIVRGHPGQSRAWRRIVSDDPEFMMPPPESNLSLTTIEKARITKWIEQGAEWKDHWAFIPPSKPKPQSKDHQPIDAFVNAALEERGIEPASPAERQRLLRRVFLDLTGLPPTIEALDAFLTNNKQSAYEEVVDQLLASDAYAERMTMEWLDVARYADSHGLHSDLPRYAWPWRDWVIKAFRENMAYDDFITWQLAGDLLPEATTEQRVATAFLRNHPTTAEGGAVNEEWRVKYVHDRTNTTATAFLGLTMECAACHDHKFDPVSQKEYYQMTAFFNNVKELGMQAEISIPKGSASGPALLLPDPVTGGKLDSLRATIASLREERRRARTSFENAATNSNPHLTIPTPTGHYPLESIAPADLDLGNVHRILSNSTVDKVVDGNPASVASLNPTVVSGKVGNALRLEDERDLIFLKDIGNFELNEPFSAGAWIRTEKQDENQTILGNSGILGDGWRGWDFFLTSENRLSLRMVSRLPHNYMQVTSLDRVGPQEWRHAFFTYDGLGDASGIALYLDGQPVETRVEFNKVFKSIVPPWGKPKGWNEKPIMVGRSGRFYSGENGVFEGALDELRVFDVALTALQIENLVASDDPDLTVQPGSPDQRTTDHAFLTQASTRALDTRIRNVLGSLLEDTEDVPEIMVMEDMPTPRKTFILNRGQYDQPTEEVEPSTPGALLAFPDELPRDRLGLATWLTDDANPLTARVAVNRYWQMIFGRGLVSTPQDFGTQGALPTHPELLDWLAVEFVESGWDVKALIKSMVMSDTYRRSSAATPDLLASDPANLYLARGPSYRLQAETIRDVALSASGLLTKTVGGESVRPYQPEGLWVEKPGPHMRYHSQSGDSLYRRSMYTYVRRTTPHPAMITFDAPNRSVCTVKREMTNTPLQALVLMNDPQFVEAARVLAQRMQKEGGTSLDDQADYAFRLVTGRRLADEERQILIAQYHRALAKYRSNPTDADTLLAVGEAPMDPSLDPAETAALTMVASTMLNHDEAYMKR